MPSEQNPAVVRVVIYDPDGYRVADSGDLIADEPEAEIVLEETLRFPAGSSLMWWCNGLPKDEKKMPPDMVGLTSFTFGPYTAPEPRTTITY